jgi:hypothetical protein
MNQANVRCFMGAVKKICVYFKNSAEQAPLFLGEFVPVQALKGTPSISSYSKIARHSVKNLVRKGSINSLVKWQASAEVSKISVQFAKEMLIIKSLEELFQTDILHFQFLVTNPSLLQSKLPEFEFVSEPLWCNQNLLDKAG